MQFRCIGGGCCGSIWAYDTASVVVKCEDGNRGRSVQNDQTMHRRVITADTSHGLPVRMPNSYDLIEDDDAWWKHHLDYLRIFPEGRVACRAYLQERIPAVPAAIRLLLIERYCPEAIQATAKASRENEDCLIRATSSHYGPALALLQPKELRPTFDQTSELGLNSAIIAQVLADTLAHCYWRAHVDANDVEFVLAPPTEPIRDSTPFFKIAGQQGLVIWMLDYDCVRDISQDREGVAQAVEAFYRNDPYFPRPHSFGHTESDLQLWVVFKAQFLKASREILGDQITGLPEEWVRQIDDESRRRAQLAQA